MDSVKWRKSSLSGNDGACVEVARLDAYTVGVRDSKAKGTGPVLRFTPDAWSSFLSLVIQGNVTHSSER